VVQHVDTEIGEYSERSYEEAQGNAEEVFRVHRREVRCVILVAEEVKTRRGSDVLYIHLI
jgi:hypothetical protein